MTRLVGAGPRRGVAVALLLGGLLGLGVLVFSPAVQSAPVPVAGKKDEPKKDEPKPAEPDDVFLPPFPDIQFPPGFDDAEMRRIQASIKEMREQTRKQLAEMRKLNPGAFQNNPFVLPPNFQFPALQGPPGFVGQGPGRQLRENRLGASVQPPGAALVDQLDLPKDQGVVIQTLKDGSAADKAGLKPNDILLELDGKSVPSKVEDFTKQLNEIKTDTPVDATVLRKGRKETVKGIKLPEVKAEEPPQPLVPNLFPPALPGLPPLPVQPALPGIGLAPAAGKSSVQFVRTGDTFTTRFAGNGATIALTGKMKDGKAEADEIAIGDGKDTKKFKAVADVPDDAREQVKVLLQMTEKGTVSATGVERKE